MLGSDGRQGVGDIRRVGGPVELGRFASRVAAGGVAVVPEGGSVRVCEVEICSCDVHGGGCACSAGDCGAGEFKVVTTVET